MKSVTLAGTGISTSELGFGCSSLLGPRTREESLRVLGTAWDAGIRHFDVARYYGYGDAEGLLGEFLRSRQEPATVTTKFGLSPSAGVSRLKGIISLVRAVMRRSALISRLVRSQVRNVVQTGRFGAEESRVSLETSLRELRRDHIDLFLLHECRAADITDELKAFLLSAVQEGKIRAFGLGTTFDDTVQIMTEHPEFAPMAQFESTPVNAHARRFRERFSQPYITHGSFNCLASLWECLAANKEARLAWEQVLDQAISGPGDLAGFVLAASRRENPQGVVLFRSTDASRVAANCAAITGESFSESQLTEFARLVSRLPR